MIEIDGVPFFTAANPDQAPDAIQGGLFFRVGMADEDYGNHGITHLVEHLVFTGMDTRSAHANGMTTDTYTCFLVHGTADEVVDFLGRIAANLANLPLERLEKEKAILRTEETRRNGAWAEARNVRHGMRDYGLSGAPEVGLNRLGADDVAAWVAQYFTADNAVGFVLAEGFEQDLRLPLPRGERREVPTPSLNPAVDPLPRAYPFASNLVVVEALVERGPATAVFAELAGARFLHELRETDALSYSVRVEAEVIGPYTVRISCVADTLPENGPGVAGCLVDALAALAAGQFGDDEFDRALAAAVEPFDAPLAEQLLITSQVIDRLFGLDHEPLAEKRDAYSAVTREAVAGVARAVRDTALWVSPVRRLEWAGIRNADFTRAPVEGHRFSQAGGVGSITVSNEGVTLAIPDSGEYTVAFADCVGVHAYPDGRRTVVGVSGVTLGLEPTLYEGLSPALLAALIDSHVPPGRLIPMPARRPGEIPTAGGG